MSVEFDLDGIGVTVLDGPYVAGGKPTPRAMDDCNRVISALNDLRLYAADQLLRLYNETWVDENIGPLDRESFAARLKSPSILLMDEVGGVVVYFEDGGMFAGHGVEVSVDDGVPSDADIVG